MKLLQILGMMMMMMCRIMHGRVDRHGEHRGEHHGRVDEHGDNIGDQPPILAPMYNFEALRDQHNGLQLEHYQIQVEVDNLRNIIFDLEDQNNRLREQINTINIGVDHPQQHYQHYQPQQQQQPQHYQQQAQQVHHKQPQQQ
uniref:Uncharacterized protein n=1 Tax=Panagrolaimus superbus TaxID=310955 RepID=A0A914YK33_9BILA